MKAGFRYGDNAPMAVIELVDRDINAKKVDVKEKKDQSTKIKSVTDEKSKKKEVKSKK